MFKDQTMHNTNNKEVKENDQHKYKLQIFCMCLKYHARQKQVRY